MLFGSSISLFSVEGDFSISGLRAGQGLGHEEKGDQTTKVQSTAWGDAVGGGDAGLAELSLAGACTTNPRHPEATTGTMVALVGTASSVLGAGLPEDMSQQDRLPTAVVIMPAGWFICACAIMGQPGAQPEGAAPELRQHADSADAGAASRASEATNATNLNPRLIRCWSMLTAGDT